MPDSFWDKVQREMEEETLLLLLLIFLAAADQFGVSGDTATRRKGGTIEGIGSIYASKRAAFVGKSWADTSRDRALTNFTGQPMTGQERREAMGKVFGVDRAAGLAVDNVTDARTHGFEVAAKETFGTDDGDLWINRPDLSKTGPCEICQPLHRKPRSHWKRYFPSGPPAHGQCVCEVVYSLNPEPAMESVTEAFDPSQPRGDDGQWISDGSISLALKSPEKAAELRAKVTDPEERAKLDKKIGPDPKATKPNVKPTITKAAKMISAAKDPDERKAIMRQLGVDAEKTSPEVMADLERNGGFLYREPDSARWKQADDVEALINDGYLDDGVIVAHYDGLEDDLPSIAKAAKRKGIEVDLATVDTITVDDVDDAEYDFSDASHYLDVHGYRFRASDHTPMTNRSAAGLVFDMRVDSSAQPADVEPLLRDAARDWIKAKTKTKADA